MARTVSKKEQDSMKKVLRFDESPTFAADELRSARNSNGCIGEKRSTKFGLSTNPPSYFTLLIIAVLVIAVTLLGMSRKWRGQEIEWRVVDDLMEDDEITSEERDQEFISFFGARVGFNLWMFIWASASGFAVGIFTWMMIYMDSVEPGINPPTPLSPRKLRERSGHNFHMGYAMAIANGFVFFIIGMWWQQKAASTMLQFNVPKV